MLPEGGGNYGAKPTDLLVPWSDGRIFDSTKGGCRCLGTIIISRISFHLRSGLSYCVRRLNGFRE